MDQLVNDGVISADIHLIRRGTEESRAELSYLLGEDSVSEIGLWEESTTGKSYEHQGYGSHFDMMQGAHVQGNARIIEKILGTS